MSYEVAHKLKAGNIISLSGYKVRVSTIIRDIDTVTISGNIQGHHDLYIESVNKNRLFKLHETKE